MSAGEKLRLGVLGSGKGSNFDSLLRAIDGKRIGAEVRAVVSDVRDAGILQIGRSQRIRATYVDPGGVRARLSPESEENIIDILRQEKVELVLLAGFMRVVGPLLLSAFPRRIINIHPSLLPKHRGLRAWAQALAAGDRVAGCTVHYVDRGVDTGEIIAQAEVDVMPGDTAETLHARIQEAEHALYPEVVAFFARERPFAV
ncbi:MAG: phosphoribosylglycinamide formyltransferase [Chthoniobacterales bacterium]|nr:phosphoribosylglycinamide formyltransferase [Chthoniobacterales bacterium]